MANRHGSLRAKLADSRHHHYYHHHSQERKNVVYSDNRPGCYGSAESEEYILQPDAVAVDANKIRCTTEVVIDRTERSKHSLATGGPLG